MRIDADGNIVEQDRGLSSREVAGGRVLTIDYPAAAAALHEAQARVKANVPNLDRDHRTAEAISPLTFPAA